MVFLGVLWAGAFAQWLFYFSRGSVDIFILTGCKITYFVYFFCFKYPSTLLVILSVEKFIALYFPFRAKTICSLSAARRVVVATAILFGVFDCQFLFTIKAQTFEDGTEVCNYVNVSPNYIRIVIRIVFPILHSFAPFTVMLVANFAIIYKFMTAKFKDEITSTALSKSATRGTAMLLTISFAFILLSGPIGILNALKTSAPQFVLWIALAFEYVNHAINSLLYCISGSRFRKELKNTVFWYRKSPDTNSTTRRNLAPTMPQTENYI